MLPVHMNKNILDEKKGVEFERRSGNKVELYNCMLKLGP